MTTVSARAFSANPIYYLNLANKESVAIKRGKMIFRITPEPQIENISPSGDPFWGNPRNIQALKDFDREKTEGKNPIVGTLRTSEDIRNFLGLSEDDI